MRHRLAGRKFSRTREHRRAMLANMAAALLKHEQIVTTLPKAKDLRPYTEKLITLGKRGDLHARRQALSVIREREVTAKVFGELAERFRERPGGYTRVLKTRVRPGDAAALSIVELVEAMEKPEPAAKKKATKKKATKKKAGGAAAKKTTKKKAAARKAD